jgi:hypothetical protein
MAKPGPGGARIAAGVIGPQLGVETLAQLDFGAAGCCIFSGTGVPGNTSANGTVPDVGDLYLRRDGAVGSLIYRATVVGPPTTWVVVL